LIFRRPLPPELATSRTSAPAGNPRS
jgi:hypothetical protein